MPGKSRVARAWRRIETVLAGRVPDVLRSLAGPASRERIAKLEKVIGAQLPRDLAESLSIHDGQRKPSYRLPPLFNGEFLLPVSEITKLARMMTVMQRKGAFEEGGPRLTRRGEPIKKDLWWQPLWLPFTDENGNYFVCDLDPAKGGHRGQVFYFSAYGHSPRRLQATSFTEWLEFLADDLDAGRFEVEDEGVWLSSKSKISPY